MSSAGDDRAAEGRTRPGAVWAVVGAMALLGLLLQLWVLTLPASAPVLTTTTSALVVAGVLLTAFLMAETGAVHVAVGRQTVTLTLSDIPLVVALFFLGPLAVVGVRVAGAVPWLFARSRTSPRKGAFNLVWFWIEACTAVLVWHGLAGHDPILGPGTWLAAAATTVLLDLLGTLLISLVVSADSGVLPDLRQVVSEANPVVAVVNAAAALLVVYVAVTDWRALWTVAVVVAVLAFAQQAHNRQRRRTESLERLGRFTGELGDQIDVASAAVTALRWMSRQLRAERVELVLAEGFAGSERGWRVGFDGVVEEVEGRGSWRALGAELASGPVLVRRGDDVAGARALRETGVRDAMAMHLLGDGDRIGTVVVANRLSDAETFHRTDVDELIALVNHLSVTLRNARRGDLIREHAAQQVRRAVTDELTGLANRQGLEQVAHDHLDDPAHGAAVVVVELDRFADVNDTLGHAAGDRLLQMVAERLTEVVPRPVSVARLHSASFAVLVPTSAAERVDAVTTTLRAALAVPFSLGALQLGVSARMGLAVCVPGLAARRPAAAGRDRGGRRRGGPHRPRGLHRRDGGRQPGAADAAHRAAGGHLVRTAAGGLPAAGAGGRRRTGRRRGAGAVGAPPARAARPGRVRARSPRTAG